MSKRRLSDQQKSRIDKNQQQLIEDYQNNLTGPEIRQSIVVSHQSRIASILDEDNNTIPAIMRQNIGDIACGDKVLWQTNLEDQASVLAILPRDSTLEKSHNTGKKKLVAANLNQILIVIACEPEPKLELLDRYLIVAQNAHIKPIIILNKVDLLDDIDDYYQRIGLDTYQQLQYPIINASAKTGGGLEDLYNLVSKKSNIFVGQSGVGKSSVTQALVPDRDVQIGRLNTSLHGRHTTSMTVLYTLQHGGQIIDSPGVRDFGIWHMDTKEIENGFIELQPFLGQCKFSDCTHIHEPECALKTAVEKGKIKPARFDSFMSIINR